MENFIDRKKELEYLENEYQADRSSFVVVYGRRRVGKTYLIEEYYNHNFAFKLTGAYRQPKKFQLESFSDELMRRAGADQPAPRNWREAVRLLRM